MTTPPAATEFTTAIINSQPMGFYAPSQLIQDVRKHEVEVLPIDVVRSKWDCTIEQRRIRLGFRLVRGFQSSSAAAIVGARRSGPFTSMHDFLRRTELPQTQVERLADTDALFRLNRTRQQAFWNVLAIDGQPRQRSHFDDLEPDDEPLASLPEMVPEDEVHVDSRTTGSSLRSHPIAFQ